MPGLRATISAHEPRSLVSASAVGANQRAQHRRDITDNNIASTRSTDQVKKHQAQAACPVSDVGDPACLSSCVASQFAELDPLHSQEGRQHDQERQSLDENRFAKSGSDTVNQSPREPHARRRHVIGRSLTNGSSAIPPDIGRLLGLRCGSLQWG